ncbi:MAG: biopolymer transporter ExbD [Pirellulales bacterium]|nr:biopolymer transporter ExbD [Pirellulales bacterium]
MRIPQHSHRAGVHMNMTPMIDVVFLLIIFFLVSSHLAQQESQYRLDLPLAISGTAPDASGQRSVTINVLADGSVIVAGRVVDTAQLESRLAYETGRVGKDLEVRIRTDRSVAYEVVEPVMLACAKAGIWNVKFAVYRKRG